MTYDRVPWNDGGPGPNPDQRGWPDQGGWDEQPQWHDSFGVIGPPDDEVPQPRKYFSGPIDPALRPPGQPSRAVTAPGGKVVYKPRRGLKKRHRGRRIVLFSLLAVVLVLGGGVGYMWWDLNGRFNHGDVAPLLGGSRPPVATQTATIAYPGDPFAGRAVNILVMGTDSRDGANAGISQDDPGGARSDTTFIAHVSADRTRVDVVSIPRDTWITIPDCVDKDGDVIDEAGWSHMGFNAAFAYGANAGDVSTGAACAIRAVEAMSKVRIDAYVVIDFMGFVNVVDSVGGLDVTVLCRIKAPEANGLDLPKGLNHLDGMTAVNLARARTGEGLGDGSDLQRITRQHMLFDALIAKVVKMNYVTDFPKLYGLVGSVIDAVTTDLGKNLTDIAGFGYSLKNFDPSAMNFATIPVGGAGNGVNVVLLPSKAEPYWTALRTDKPLPATDNSETETPSPSPSPDDPSSLPGPPPDPGVTGPVDPGGPATGVATPPAAPYVQQPSDCD